MNAYYLDTSALVKLFVTEQGSQWMETLVLAKDPQNTPLNLLVFSQAAIVELGSALSRKVRAAKISSQMRRELLDDFRRRLLQEFLPLEINAEILWKAAELTETRALRSYDAIHLATALAFVQNTDLPALTFVSADENLLQACRNENLPTFNPNTQP
ncbi:MAG: type II toxin-antitoxin system VapC family toxin [Anaerolineales bacterium]